MELPVPARGCEWRLAAARIKLQQMKPMVSKSLSIC